MTLKPKMRYNTGCLMQAHFVKNLTISLLFNSTVSLKWPTSSCANLTKLSLHIALQVQQSYLFW